MSSCINNLTPTAMSLFELMLEYSNELSAAATYDKESLRDIFFAVYQTDEPEIDTKVDPSGPFLSDLIDSDPGMWIDYRDFCKLRPVEAALTAIALLEFKKMCGDSKGEYRSNPSRGPQMQQELDKLKNNVDKTEKVEEELLDDAELSSTGEGAGLGEGNPMYLRHELESRLALATAIRRSRADLAKVFEFIGRLQEIRADVEGEKYKGSDEQDDITLGRDIAQVLPSELAQDPALFAANFVDSKLQQYEAVSKMKEGLGPVVVLLDKSGSMGFCGQDQHRDEWATALCFVLLRLARDQKRDIVFVPFNQVTQAPIEIKDGKSSIDQVIQLLSSVPSGGTSFRNAFAEGLEQIKKMDKADILMITDGHDESSERHFNPKDERTKDAIDNLAKVYVFNIGDGGKYCRKMASDKCFYPNVQREQNAENALKATFERLLERRKHFLD